MKRLIIPLLLLLTLSCRQQQEAVQPPLVGVSSFPAQGYDLIQSQYPRAIALAGGVPVILPAVTSEDEAAGLLARLDAVVFTGGSDVSPAFYGEAVLDSLLVQTDPARDRSDSLLGRAALAAGKPVLAICRGSQLLNVLLGGSLYQDIPTQTGSTLHAQGVNRVVPEPDTFLGQIFGSDTLSLWCGHHQAVKAAAPGTRIAAKSADGLPEAWENGPVWGVQFHPEGLLEYEQNWLKLFSAFVEKAKQQDL